MKLNKKKPHAIDPEHALLPRGAGSWASVPPNGRGLTSLATPPLMPAVVHSEQGKRSRLIRSHSTMEEVISEFKVIETAVLGRGRQNRKNEAYDLFVASNPKGGNAT